MKALCYFLPSLFCQRNLYLRRRYHTIQYFLIKKEIVLFVVWLLNLFEIIPITPRCSCISFFFIIHGVSKTSENLRNFLLTLVFLKKIIIPKSFIHIFIISVLYIVIYPVEYFLKSIIFRKIVRCCLLLKKHSSHMGKLIISDGIETEIYLFIRTSDDRIYHLNASLSLMLKVIAF